METLDILRLLGSLLWSLLRLLWLRLRLMWLWLRLQVLELQLLLRLPRHLTLLFLLLTALMVVRLFLAAVGA